jgi:hypothetical protein
LPSANRTLKWNTEVDARTSLDANAHCRADTRGTELNRDEHDPRASACRQASPATFLGGSGAAKCRNFSGLRTT